MRSCIAFGSVLSFHASAQGKVATAFSSPDFQARMLHNKLELFTPHTVTAPSLLLKEFARIRAQGWATAPGQIALGLNTLAGPVFDASGRVCGAIGIVYMVQQIPGKAERAACPGDPPRGAADLRAAGLHGHGRNGVF